MNTKFVSRIERLDSIFQELVRRIHQYLQQNRIDGITPSQFMVLKQINDGEGGRATVSMVAEKLGVSLSAVTSQVERLHEAGYVRRSRDEKDRRVVRLIITPQGKEMMQKFMDNKVRVIEHFFSRLPEEDVDKLVEIYEKLLAVIKEEEKVHQHSEGRER